MKFQAFWHGRKLSAYEHICIKSFIANGHEIDLYCYERVEAEGVNRKNATEILPAKEMFYGRGRHTGCFSNLFRFQLLWMRGGWWIDMDVVCLSPNIPTYKRFFARQDDKHLNTAVLYAEAGDPLMARCLERANQIGKRADDEGIRTGPFLLTSMAKEMNLADEAQPAITCYPLQYEEAPRIIEPGFSVDLSKSFMLHLWAQVLRWNNIDQWRLPPKGSMMRALADKYPVNGWHKERAEA